LHEDISQELTAKLGAPWEMATRDDPRVAQDLHQGEIDRAYSLQENALLDEFFHYLRKICLWDELEQFKPQKAERLMIPFVQFLLLYMLKTLFGIESINAL